MANSILIRGGTVIDGTGKPGVPLDLAIDGSKISGFHKRGAGSASTEIDADGLVVCPGFVDIHTHSELTLLANPLAESKVRQGVTTELVGNCGTSAAPAVGAARECLKESASLLDVGVDWTSMDEYLSRLEAAKPSVNACSLVGAETLRRCVIGNRDQKADEDSLARMKELLADAMLQGAFGLSSGLIYAPGCYADTAELSALATTSAAFGGLYASHIRGEGKALEKAVDEAIAIGRESHSRVEISHHKACGPLNWGKVKKTMLTIERARKEGVDVTFDVYPYTASCTTLDTLLPPWAHDGGREAMLARITEPRTRERMISEFETPASDWEDTAAEVGWDKIVLIGFRNEANRRFEGRSVKEISLALGKSPADSVLDLLVEEDLHLMTIFHEISEDDVCEVIRHPLSSIGSDGDSLAPYGVLGQTHCHPRAYGAFPRVIRRFCLEKKVVTLQEAIRKMTSLPAGRLGLEDRGILAKGFAADVVIFDPEEIADVATFERPRQYPRGVNMVIVNGTITVEDGEHNGGRAGQVFRHKPAIA